jgi:hypothetical protein
MTKKDAETLEFMDSQRATGGLSEMSLLAQANILLT